MKPADQDRLLVERCLAHDPAAWSQMYARFHETLRSAIKAYLGRASQDANLLDEIAARVWYALVRDDFKLLAKFDAARGCRLATFLSVLAKSESRMLLRAERRRKTREQAVSKGEAERDPTSGALGRLSNEEFVKSLSPAERKFYLEVLVTPGQLDDETDYTAQNAWQLRHRVRRKLERLLYPGL